MSDKSIISAQNVQYIASLARISLKDEEIDNLTQDLESILHYINKLEKLDVGDIDPTSHVLPLKNVYRDDTIKPSLSQRDALKNAVVQHKGSFKVPLVIE